jgi:hypothetical protein
MNCSAYIFVMVKLPEPVQPEVTPLNTQVPLTALLLTCPWSVRVLPLGLPDCTVICSAPVTLPLKFPASANPPVAVCPEAKHGDDVVKLKLVTLSELPLDCVNVVPKAKTGEELPELISEAVQLPLTLPPLLEEFPPPQPPRIRTAPKSAFIPGCFIGTPLRAISALNWP